MKAVEFKSTVGPNGQIMVPPDVVQEIPTGEQVRICRYVGSSILR